MKLTINQTKTHVANKPSETIIGVTKKNIAKPAVISKNPKVFFISGNRFSVMVMLPNHQVSGKFVLDKLCLSER
jgi:hypothetical protein